MTFSNLPFLLKLADNYYNRVIKYSVPLEEIVHPPGGRFKSTDPQIPRLQDYQSVFANTAFKYRVIYTNFTFGVRTGYPLTLDQFKTNVEKYIKNISIYGDLSLSEQEKIKLQQAKYLIQHWDHIFKNDSIHIIANMYDSGDLVTPEALVHDIGHTIMGKFNQYNLASDIFYGLDWIKSINQDYHIYHHGNQLSESEADQLLQRSESRGVLIKLILAKNNLVPGSIGEYNLAKGYSNDLLPEVFLYYNLGGESFRDLKLRGISFYADKFLSRVSETLEGYIEIMNRGRDYYYFTPKDPNGKLPAIENLLRGEGGKLDLMEKIIKGELQELLGKVMVIWDRSES